MAVLLSLRLANATESADYDFAQLGLQVKSVTAVPSLQMEGLGSKVVTPKPGRQLVIVQLQSGKKGKWGDSFSPASNWSDIQAVYSTDASDGMGFAIETACAFLVMKLAGGKELWTLSKTCQAGNGPVVTGMQISGHAVTSKDGNLVRIPNIAGEVTVVFNLPSDVKAFTLRFPVAARDGAGAVVQKIK